MEKQIGWKKEKSLDVPCVIVGVSILFSASTAALGFESLSISGIMIFAVACVLGCLVKDGVEFCRELTDEE